MGEVTSVKQVSFGTVAIDVAKVAPLPTSEEIVNIAIERTVADKKWSQFPLRTTERSLVVNPGSIGTAAFDAICEKAAAMFETAQGIAFLGALQAVVAGKPLEARSKVEVVEAVTVVAQK